MMEYIFVIVLSFIALLIYLKIADRFNIVDKPSERGSHTVVTIRGGGVVVWFVAFIYLILYDTIDPKLMLFFFSLTMISMVSFIDDILTISGKLRALIQFLALAISIYALDIHSTYSFYLIIPILIVLVGIINAYNFMDGINGITGLYSLSVFFSFFLLNEFFIDFEDSSFLVYPMIACVVFLFFNYRKKAKCFAGDIGSVSLAFWVIFLLMELSIKTNSCIWILFLSVYGVDSVCTILHRLYLRHNIFQPHRLHFYQILSNEQKIDHRMVSIGYAMLQLLINILVFYLFNNNFNQFVIALIVLIPLVCIYLFKFKLMSNKKSKEQMQCE